MSSTATVPSSSRISLRMRHGVTALLGLYFALAWFGGGSTVDVTAVDEWLMLLALPVLVAAAYVLLRDLPSSRLLHAGLVIAAVLPLLLLLQLLAVPQSVWGWSEARQAIAADLVVAGATTSHAWSLWPEASERSMFAILPALACFMGALAVGESGRRKLVPLALGLVLANLAFGFFQVGLPATSAMRLHPGSGTGFGGVLANGNHQGTALIVGMLLSLGLWSRLRRRQRDGAPPQPWKNAAYATAALVCLAAVPLTASSGATLIALIAFAVGVLATGVLSLRRMRHSRWGLAAGVSVLAVLVLGLVSVSGWLDIAQSDADRYVLARDVATLGMGHAPLGSGVGTFVESFAQGGTESTSARSEYVNHAHNEYAQWWFEAGWLGLIAVLAVLGLFAAVGLRLFRSRRRDPLAIACWLAVAAVLLHSGVDFPLRTLSMMAMSALLAGYALAAAASRAPREPVPENTDAALQPA